MDIRQFDYKAGDIVQLIGGKCSGKVGEIIGEKLDTRQEYFVYTVKLSDKRAVTATAHTMRLVRSK